MGCFNNYFLFYLDKENPLFYNIPCVNFTFLFYGETHGTETLEDMAIPLVLLGKDFVLNSILENSNIKDFAPTITKLLGVNPDPE